MLLLLEETAKDEEATVVQVVVAPPPVDTDAMVVMTLEDDMSGEPEADEAGEPSKADGLRQLSLLGVIRSSLAFSGWLSLLWSSTLGEHDVVVTSLRPFVDESAETGGGCCCCCLISLVATLMSGLASVS